MNQKGFTMIEVLGIVTVIGVLLLMSVPSITSTFKKADEKEYDDYMDNLLIAAEAYIESNRSDFPSLDNEGGKVVISIATLIDNGYIKKTVIDPKTKEEIPVTYSIIATKTDGQINYVYNASSYVQDGLILLYDGYNKPTDNLWKDLSGNDNDGVLTNFNKNSWNGDSVIFDGADDYIDLANKLSKLYNSSNTIEIVADFDPTQIKSVLIGNDTTKIEKGNTTLQSHLYYNSGAVDYYTENNFYTLGEMSNYTYTFDKVNKTFKFYQKGEMKFETTDNNFSTNTNYNNVKIGNSENSIKGKIYSVRVYDRVLTDNEIKKNYDEDLTRFGSDNA